MTFVRDFIALAGALILVLGCAQVYKPLAMVVGGVILIGLAIWSEVVSKWKAENESDSKSDTTEPRL